MADDHFTDEVCDAQVFEMLGTGITYAIDGHGIISTATFTHAGARRQSLRRWKRGSSGSRSTRSKRSSR